MKRLPVRFYQLPTGREPVRDWLRSLAPEDRQAIGDDIRTVEFAWPVGMPICRRMGDGLWEVRSTLPGGRIARVLSCVSGGSAVLLHGFLKTGQKTPPRELRLARTRRKDLGA